MLLVVIPWFLLLVLGQSVGQGLPSRTGEVVFAVQCGLWKIYNGGWLNATDQSWTSPVTGIKYYNDDPYCVSHNGYDCICHDSCCGNKRCYQMDSNTANADDDKLFYCTRIGERLHWRFPASVIGPPGTYHFSLIISDDKWHEFANSNNGRKFEIWINGVSQGVFDLYGWTAVNRWGVAEDFNFVLTASDSYVDFQMTRYVFDGGNPNSPLAHAIEIRKGPGLFSPRYGRQDHFRQWTPQLYDGSTWLYVIDVGGGGFNQTDGLAWSPDFGNYFPPNIIGTGRMSWPAADPMTNTAPFDVRMWRTLRKSYPAAGFGTTDSLRLLPLTYKLPVPSDGTYWVLLFYIDDDYSKPFYVEFGQCNDIPGTGATYYVNMTYGWPGTGSTDRQAHIFGYQVVSRDKIISIHFPLYDNVIMPVLAGIMIRPYDGVTPSFLSGPYRQVMPKIPFATPTCQSQLKGAYPDYDDSGVTYSSAPVYQELPPAPPQEPTPGPNTPTQQGTLLLALQTSLYKIYEGALLTSNGTWLDSKQNITYRSDDPFCIPESDYDCACLASTCLSKRCYQLCRKQLNTDDDDLYQCSRIGTHLHWQIPVSLLGPPGDYHVSILMTEDKWHEFAKSNNGRKFEVHINGNWMGDFDLYGWTGGTDYVVSEEFPITIVQSQATVDVELIRYTFDGSNPNSPVVQALQFRTGLPSMSPLYSRPPRLQAWTPQTFDGSTWLWAIDVMGGGYWDAVNSFWWSMDFGYFYPPNKAGAGGSSWRGSPSVDTISPFPAAVWSTIRKSPGNPDGSRILPMTYKIPVPKNQGRYLVVLLYMDDDYPAPFTVEFGRCNDIEGSGAVYPVDIGHVPNTCYMVGYYARARDGLITMHFPTSRYLYTMPALSGILIKEDDERIPTFLTGPHRKMETEIPYNLTECNSTLVGNYPDYLLSGILNQSLPPVDQTSTLGSSDSNTGAIVGGIIGGLLALILIVALVFKFGLSKDDDFA